MLVEIRTALHFPKEVEGLFVPIGTHPPAEHSVLFELTYFFDYTPLDNIEDRYFRNCFLSILSTAVLGKLSTMNS